MKENEVDADVVRTLARVAGIKLPEEDVEPLVGALRNHLAGMKALDELDLDEADPIVTFDPRWE
jgi:Asp-tRNA(Asn)/Glu-tRNA(Gln) amidotransferase C subunit